VAEMQASGFIESNHAFTARFKTKDGTYRTIEWQGVLSGDFIYAAARDITVRKKTESFEKELLDLSIQLTGIPVSEITGAINTALRRIGKFLSADRAYIFEVNSPDNTWSNTFEWCNDGITPEIDNLQNVSIELFPAWNEKFRRKENVIIASVEDLPESRHPEKEVLKSQSIQSLIAIPMLLENKLIGFVGLDSVAGKKEYNNSEVNILRVWGNLLTSLISSRLTGEYLEQTRNNYESFFNTINDFAGPSGEYSLYQ
jgi:transcriptional regulator with GAF, ATPase, and Fis domain